MVDLLIEDVDIASANGVERGSIAIEDGEIEAVGPAVDADADDLIDGEGRVAMPGVVDIHNHLQDAELFPEGIDAATQTKSALAGGVTTVVMLPTQTPKDTPEAIREWRETIEELTHVDFGLIAGNIQDPTVDVEGIMAEGVPDFKTFTAEPYQMDDGGIVKLMDRVGEAGGKVRVHSESQGILDHAREQIDSDDPAVYPRTGPVEAELDAVNRVGLFGEYTDCPVHPVHISSGSGVREADRFKSRAKIPITIETCPHYLAFSEDDAEELGPFLKVNPGLKSEEEVKRLWAAVEDGTVDLIASEHFPTYREEREKGWENIWEPYAGLPGLETMLEFLVSEGVHEGRITWERLVELVASRPAKEARIFPRKGAIREGTDADLVLVGEDEYTVSAEDLVFNGGWTPYEGMEWTATVDVVIRDGEIAAEDHEVSSQRGAGEFIPRGPKAE
ncbi:MAG: dihydroorotase family protein [Halodesulfurarchaeum sp.]